MRGWERDGHRSCAHWLAFRTGIDLGAAREKVRAARALEDLPETSAAMARGRPVVRQGAGADPGGHAGERRRPPGAGPGEHRRGAGAHGAGLAAAEPEGRGRPGADPARVAHAVGVSRRRRHVRGARPARSRGGRPADAGRGGGGRRALSPGSGGGRRRRRSRRSSAGPTPWGCWPSGRWRRGRTAGAIGRRSAGPAPSATRSCSTWRPGRWSGPASPGGRSWRTARAFPRKRPGGSRATPRWWRSGTDRTAGSSTSGAAGARFRPPSEGRWRPGTAAAAFPGAARGSPTPTTSCTGPTEARRSWTTWCSLCRFHHRLLHEEGYRLELNPWPGGRPVFYDPRGLPVPEAPPLMAAGPGAVEALIRANRSERGRRRRGIRRRAGGSGRRTFLWTSGAGGGGGVRGGRVGRRCVETWVGGRLRETLRFARLLGVPESPDATPAPRAWRPQDDSQRALRVLLDQHLEGGDRLVSDRRGG